MKLYLLCAVIILLLLSICFVSTFAVTDIIDQTEEYMQQALMLYQTHKETEGYAQIQKTDTFWKKHNHVLGMLLYHSEIDEVTTELAMLEAYAITGNTEELYSSFAELFTLLERIREMEYPYFKNIL